MVSFESCGRGGGLVVSVLNSGLTAQGSSPGGYVFVLCSRAEATLFSLHLFPSRSGCVKFDFKFEGFNKKIKHYYFFLDFDYWMP